MYVPRWHGSEEAGRPYPNAVDNIAVAKKKG